MIKQPLIITYNQITINKTCPKCGNYLLTINAHNSPLGIILKLSCPMCDYANDGLIVRENECLCEYENENKT